MKHLSGNNEDSFLWNVWYPGSRPCSIFASHLVSLLLVFVHIWYPDSRPFGIRTADRLVFVPLVW